MISDQNILIETIPIGPMANLAYLVGDGELKKAAIIDPGWDIRHILDEAKKFGMEIVCGLLTHGHYDHSDAAKKLVEKLNIPIYISEKEMDIYIPDCPRLEKFKNRQKIEIGNIKIECFNTPGHTPGCTCFYVPGHLFTGDTLFVNACGRCDLPGGSEKTLRQSLEMIIKEFPPETIIYPGHAYGPHLTSTLSEQKKTNPYLK